MMHKITGIVQHGEKKGRTIHFPTINITYTGDIPEATYAVNIEYEDTLYTGVGVYIRKKGIFEAHILGFSSDIYGEELTLYIIGKIRDNKIFGSLEGLKEQIQRDILIRETSSYNVLTFGSFDHVHDGHAYYLSEAKKYGDHLITIVATDENIIKIKGKSPQYPQNQRIQDIQKLHIVDEVVPGNNTNPLKWLQVYSPSTICLGYDQRGPFLEKLDTELQNLGLRTQIIRIEPYYPDTYKSSLLKK